MESLIYIGKITLYFIFVFILYMSALKNKKKLKLKNKKARFSVISLIVLSIIIGSYSVLSSDPNSYAYDRSNYALRFTDDLYFDAVKSASLGLYYVESFLHIFTYNPNVLFFTITFLCSFLFLVAYNKFYDVAPNGILYLGLSNCFICSFYLLKQAPAIALIALSFAAYSCNKKFICIILTLLASCFHESAWIMVPIYMVLIGSKLKFVRILEYLGLLVCVVWFEDISKIVISLFNFIPGMEQQLSSYINDSNSIEVSSNILTIFKGIPYYFITFIAIIKRNILKDKIKNYDKYLTLCIITCMFIIMSYFMYWMWRFATYCYFPVLMFASLICREIKDISERNRIKAIICLSFAFITGRYLLQTYFKYGGF